jgi:hypothetical protein
MASRPPGGALQDGYVPRRTHENLERLGNGHPHANGAFLGIEADGADSRNAQDATVLPFIGSGARRTLGQSCSEKILPGADQEGCVGRCLVFTNQMPVDLDELGVVAAEQGLFCGDGHGGNRLAGTRTPEDRLGESGRTGFGNSESNQVHSASDGNNRSLGSLSADSARSVANAERRAGPLKGDSSAQMHAVKRIVDLVPSQ